MDNEKKIEQLVLTGIDTAKAMLDEYQLVVPFGIRAYKDNHDMKMNCSDDSDLQADWNEQINKVVTELKEYVKNENIFATVLVTDLQSDDSKGIGLQVESELSSVLFVYPYEKVKDEWVIDEPIQTDQLLTRVY
ncbi:hypothetical protein MNBD_GAMMA08-2865 [hydrothermal vent metagenome]|uniref:Uncharacterized protein n=1 Tax=hydrothermal vent metagenome TaxID=652676 RepID=A0A3B0WVJ1_9ZZZZ